MRSEVYSLSYVDGMIDYLESKIDQNAVTESLLSTMQKWLDKVEETYRDTEQFGEFYSRLLELQTLIFGESNEEAKALDFMKEAVRQAGGVSMLYSQLLQDYIARSVQSPAVQEMPVPAMPVAPVPVVDMPETEPESSQEPIHQDFADLADQITDHKPAKHATEVHDKRPKYRKLKVAFAGVFVLAIVGVAVAHFVPQTSAVSMLIVKHGQITRAKDHYASLTVQYKSCSDKLATERDSVDTASDEAVAAYNQEMKNCQSILEQQHHAADVYNQLIGKS